MNLIYVNLTYVNFFWCEPIFFGSHKLSPHKLGSHKFNEPMNTHYNGHKLLKGEFQLFGFVLFWCDTNRFVSVRSFQSPKFSFIKSRSSFIFYFKYKRLVNFNDHTPATKFSFFVSICSRTLVPKPLKYELNIDI